MLPETKEEAANLLAVSLGLAFLVSILSFLSIWFGRQFILSWLQMKDMEIYLWLIPPTVFIVGVSQVFNYWNSRTKNFGLLSIAKITSSLATTASMLGFGYLGHATSGAMIGSSIGGQAIITAIWGGQIWHDNAKLFQQSIRWRDIIVVSKRYRKFPYYDTWAAALNVTSWQLPIFILSTFFPSTIVGFYSLGFRVLQIPMSIVGSAIGQVFFQRAVDAHAQGTLNSLVENVFRQLVMLSLFPMLMLCIISKDLFFIIFGPGWVEAGIYVQILSIWAFCWFVSSPLGLVFSALEKQEHMLRWNLVNFGTRFTSLWVGGVFQDARMAIILFSSSGVLIYGYMIFSILISADVSLRKAGQILLVNFLLFFPAGVLLIYLTMINVDVYIKSLIAMIFWACHLFYIIKTQWNFIRPSIPVQN
jgi:O-antigen/teichoic acid export membrane protein